MRIVLVGASSLALMTARLLIERGHDVVIIEQERTKIDAVAETLDCGFICGDGSKPVILREADPGATDVLFCLTGNDQANILASLVGRSLGYRRVVTKIEEPEFQHICIELGLEDTIIPSRTIGHYLADTARGMNLLELSGVLRDDVRIFSFVARGEDAVAIGELPLPESVRIMCLYRDDRFVPVQDDTPIRPGDEVVLITRSKHLEQLTERWPGNGRTHSR